MILLIVSLFVIGYIAIAFEHSIKINKSATALLTGVLCWATYILYTPDKELVNEQLVAYLGDLSGILFFLLGAMTIVELVDAHNGFSVINEWITETRKRQLMWIIGFLTFFLSAILDNLTTTIVMISLLRKLIRDDNDRLYFVGIVVIAANAGGAWSPIGDVTTTMLWMGGQISTARTMVELIFPSLLSLIIPLIIISFQLKGKVQRADKIDNSINNLPKKQQYIIFYSGVGALILVPVIKAATHLPPFMGILFGLAVLWIITELLHNEKDDAEKYDLSVVSALRRIDTASILFFLGILVSVAAMQATGILTNLAHFMTSAIGNDSIIVIAIGLLSSIVDNVPLVAAAKGMYTIAQYPMDHYFWQFLAYSAGTGGSILIIGSAAGVAAMGMEKINFFWYMRKISWLALLGFFAGAFAYILQSILFS